jgi:hypothetical protein
MPASLAALPLSDVIIQKFGYYGGFQTINILSLAYNSIRLHSPNLNAQILSFIIFSFFRSFLFGVTFSYIPFVLPPRNCWKDNWSHAHSSKHRRLGKYSTHEICPGRHEWNFFHANFDSYLTPTSMLTLDQFTLESKKKGRTNKKGRV